MNSSSRDSLTRRVQFFTGKGGVGKSTVLSALATAAARAGRNPLIVELGAHTSSSHLFAGPDVGYDPTEVSPGVYATRVQFEPALVDYITSRLKLRFVATLVARNPSLRKLFLAAPGVDEIVTLHRVAQLAGDERWNPILVDLESTGHALMFFDLPEVLEVFLKDGPLRQVLDTATALVRDPRRSAVHVVTVPEPLAVSETIQLFRELRDRTDLHLGCLFINRVPQDPLSDDEIRMIREALAKTEEDDPSRRDLLVADYLARRIETAKKCMRGLQRDVDLPRVLLKASDEEGARIVVALADALTQEGA